MVDKKISVLLSAKDALSPAFASADKSLEKMRRKAGDASAALGELKKQQSDVKAHMASQQALKVTNQKLAENKQRLEASKAALRDAQAEQRRYQKGIASAENTLRELDVELARNGKLTRDQRVAYTQATQSLEQLRPEYKKASAEVAAKRREDNAATRQMTSLTLAADKERARLQSLGRTMKEAGTDTRNLAREQARLSTDTAKASASLQRQESRIIAINKAQARMAANKQVRQGIKNRAMGSLAATPLGGVATTALTAAPFVASGKKAMEYEYSWADVQKVSNFKDAKQDREVQLAARKQAGDLGISQTGMTDILAAAGQAGVANDKFGNVDPKQLLRFGADAAKVAVAFDSDAKTSGDTMATIRTSLKLNQDQVMSLFDVINAESNKMNAKAMVVAGIMKRQGANGGLAGFNFKQIAGLTSALVASGDTEETGATALKNITGRLTKGFSATKRQKRSLSMLGLDPGVLAKDMQQNAVGTTKMILEAINKQAPDKQKAIISDIFGEEVAGSVAKLAKNMPLFDQAMDIANDKLKYRGSLQQEYDTKAATRQFKLNQMKARMENAEIALGNLLLPLIDSAAPVVSDLANSISGLLENSERARTVLKGTAYAIGGLIALKATVGTFKWIKTLGSDLWNAGKIAKAKLNGATDRTARSASRAAATLERMNRQMDMMGGGNGSGSRRRRLGGSPGRRGRRFTPAPKFRGGGMKAGLAGAVFALPDAYAAYQSGDAADAGAAVGSMGGGIAGAEIGAAIGTAILPGIGTAIGGAIGGLAGSELGQKMGEVVGPYIKEGWEGLKGWFSSDDKAKPASDKVAKVKPKDLALVNKNAVTPGIDAAVAKAKSEQPPPVPVYHIKIEGSKFDVKASGDPAQDNALTKKIEAILVKTQTKALHDALANTVDSRLNASLSGQRSD